MIAHSSLSRFSIGVPVIATRRRACSVRSARARFVCGFFTSCASSRISRSQSTSRERLDVARRDVVRRDDDVDRVRLAVQLLVRRAGRCRDADARAAPARSDATSATHCRATLIGQTTSVGPNASRPGLLALRHEHRDRLHRLPEPHVVGQDRRRSRGRRAAAATRARVSWNGNRSCAHPRRRRAAAGSARPRRRAAARRASGRAAPSPSSSPASSVSRPDTARTSSTTPTPLLAPLEEAERALRRPPRAPPASGPRPARPGSSRPRARAAPRRSSSVSPTASRQSNDASTDVESSPLDRRVRLAARGHVRAQTRVGARTHADGSSDRHVALVEPRHQARAGSTTPSRRRAPPRTAASSSNSIPSVASSGRARRGRARGRRADRPRARTRTHRRPPPRGATPAGSASGRRRHAATARARARRADARRDAGRAATSSPSPRRGRCRPSATAAARAPA